MISSAIIIFTSFILNIVTAVFPTGDGLPPEVFTAVSTLGGYIGVLSPVLPINTLSTVLILVITLELIIFGFKMFRWLFGFVPFIGKS